jgi:hypothetical protein
MKLAFCIRGHIRDGFGDKQLLNYIGKISKTHEVDLFLHTWAESEARSSYRKLDRSSVYRVNNNHLTDYFTKLNIKSIIIENDADVKLYGDTDGYLPGSKCPLIAWKRMWAGKFSLMSYLYSQSCVYDRVINTRYDMFTNPVCYTPVKKLILLTEESSELSVKYPKYYRHLKGVDNYYAGSLETIYSLTKDFHFGLDDMLKRFKIRVFHEEIFYKYAKDAGIF